MCYNEFLCLCYNVYCVTTSMHVDSTTLLLLWKHYKHFNKLSVSSSILPFSVPYLPTKSISLLPVFCCNLECLSSLSDTVPSTIPSGNLLDLSYSANHICFISGIPWNVYLQVFRARYRDPPPVRSLRNFSLSAGCLPSPY